MNFLETINLGFVDALPVKQKLHQDGVTLEGGKADVQTVLTMD